MPCLSSEHARVAVHSATAHGAPARATRSESGTFLTLYPGQNEQLPDELRPRYCRDYNSLLSSLIALPLLKRIVIHL
ncbi:hypothetical protein CHELA1G11_20414 [Hyphomicrobiales bacterium]|nr:hypothetical protein CHELA1G11_20414 [Hyphomicrobiales bacterium]CAH1690095.1 hypothetical protein CHELA1G2_20727 [Hyphomicrobiales bacterium]